MIRKLFLSAIMLALFPVLVLAHEYHAGSLLIEHPWARATPTGIDVGGGYMKIVNEGKGPDRLTGASLSVAKKTLIHEMKMEDGISKMRPLMQGLEIEPGATVELKPDSFHLMFEGLQQPLVQGTRVKGTLVFEKAGTVPIEFAVEGIGAKSGSPAHSMSHMAH